MADFDELAAFRKALKEFSLLHKASVMSFYDAPNKRFSIGPISREDPEPGDDSHSTKVVRHLTSTITCVESLKELFSRELSRPLTDDDAKFLGESMLTQDDKTFGDALDGLLKQFQATALDNPRDWDSDGAAWVYCRVRTLGSLLRMTATTDVTVPNREASVLNLVSYAWNSRDTSSIYGLREAAGEECAPIQNGALVIPDALLGPPGDRTYPPNAFLTYWGLLSLEACRDAPAFEELHALHYEPATEWLSASVPDQVAYQYQQSKHADPQQLAWALCAMVRFSGDDLESKTSVTYTKLTAGLRAFFEQQDG